jgi:hypothetical protein
MAIRRLDGHGTISKVKNRDLYQIQVRITVDGKKRRVTRYGKTKK